MIWISHLLANVGALLLFFRGLTPHRPLTPAGHIALGISVVAMILLVIVAWTPRLRTRDALPDTGCIRATIIVFGLLIVVIVTLAALVDAMRGDVIMACNNAAMSIALTVQDLTALMPWYWKNQPL